MSSLIAHRDDAGIADQVGVNVFVGGGVLQDGAGVQPRLMGESAGPHISRLPLRHAVKDVIQHPAIAQQAAKARGADTSFKLAGIGLFEQQGGDQRGQVRIATPLAQHVERALDLAHPSIDSGQ